MKKIKDKLSDIKWAEHKISLGFENKDKTFYVIRRRSKTVGLFSYILTAIGQMKYAEDNGYIPIVDMKNYENPYLDKKTKKNVWEYYFQQPAGYTMESIKKSRNIILSDGEIPACFPDYPMFSNEKELLYWREKCHQFIRLNTQTEKHILKMQEELFDGKRILGIICRGTDYRELKPKEHPIQPEVKDMIAKAQTVMVQQKCEKIYLATEDREILKEFKNIFGDKLVFPDLVLRPYHKGDFISTIEVERQDDRRLKGLEYLTQIALLARCNCFIGSGCGGSYGALLMSNGYEWEYRWDLGVYK